MTEKPEMLEKIDVHLTDHCNLNCQGCTHFSPLAQEFYLDLQDFKNDIGRLAALTGAKLGQMFLLGGEPLLHPQLTQFFQIAREFFPNTQIIIITNGILLPEQPDEFWLACKKSNIRIWVSLYRLKIDYETIDARAKQFGVFCGYTGTRTNEEHKKDWGSWKLDKDGQQYWADAFTYCKVKNCVTLKKGKLYTCPTIAHIEHLNKYFGLNFEVTPYDYIDIYKIRNHQAILDTMVKPVPFCRYCKTRSFEKCVWAPTKRDVSEWVS
ncbi:MAG: radical SAM protein [Cyanobacteriota bacterium]|nr:radical SAM protein [Cyanobacteriota bacterium]MDY6363661.1 radical SAM protein [Cyanobacteriota bacterium]MDY6382581.1 radical SAM protein [Cyanobacteriota bacterium]